jgi:hypothetical protein
LGVCGLKALVHRMTPALSSCSVFATHDKPVSRQKNSVSTYQIPASYEFGLILVRLDPLIARAVSKFVIGCGAAASRMFRWPQTMGGRAFTEAVVAV